MSDIKVFFAQPGNAIQTVQGTLEHDAPDHLEVVHYRPSTTLLMVTKVYKRYIIKTEESYVQSRT